MSDLNSDNSGWWSGQSRIFPRWTYADKPLRNAEVQLWGSGGRGLSCGRYAASLRLTGCAGHRRFAPDASRVLLQPASGSCSATPSSMDRDLPRRQRLAGEIIVVISGRYIPGYAIEHAQDRELQR